MSKVTLGGDRLGSGNKMQVDLSEYGKSNHDLGYAWRSTMAPGTLVPFMNLIATPDDYFKVSLDSLVKTLPTVGPLFGSYKMQLDVFSIPLRLYNSKLHNNPVDIGMAMNTVKLPQIELNCPNIVAPYGNVDTQQVNPSSLLAYLGIKSFGHCSGETDFFRRSFLGVGALAYADVCKNYYFNKQEKMAYVIHNDGEKIYPNFTSWSWNAINGHGNNGDPSGTDTVNIDPTAKFEINKPNMVIRLHSQNEINLEYVSLDCLVYTYLAGGWVHTDDLHDAPILKYMDILYQDANLVELQFKHGVSVPDIYYTRVIVTGKANLYTSGISLKPFEIKNIDLMRVEILKHSSDTAFTIGNIPLNPVHNIEPYNLQFKTYYDGSVGIPRLLSCSQNQEGLFVKTYLSDKYNNWLRDESITGIGGINELTKIDTSEGFFYLDTLRLANKVNMLLQRILVSGGTYKDYIKAAWNSDAKLNSEIPVYEGGAFQEIVFEEVVSNSAAPEEPLGSLAGRGHNRTKQNGGTIHIHVDEPSYIMGIVSITPRIDYCQGNEWFVNLKTLDDLHKPQMDQIGFQDLLTEEMVGVTTHVSIDGVCDFKSIGKQPAWLNYMTDTNKVFGEFARKDSMMYMVLPRRYDVIYDEDKNEFNIGDATTYIDPVKFNYMFADTRLDAQNFMVQIGVDIEARRVMSSKIMPNL